jgi:hypothetical protein
MAKYAKYNIFVYMIRMFVFLLQICRIFEILNYHARSSSKYLGMLVSHIVVVLLEILVRISTLLRN